MTLHLAAPAGLMERTDLSAHAKLVWMGLAQFAGSDGIARPLLVDLQRVVGLGDRTLRRGLAELVDAELLVPSRKGGVTGFRFAEVVGYVPGKQKISQGADRQNSENAQRFQEHDCQPAGTEDCMTAKAATKTGQVIDAVDLFQSAVRPPRGRATSSSNLEIEDTSLPSEKKKGGAGGKRRKQPVPLAPDWCPDAATLAHCQKQRPDVDLSRELESFRFYFISGKAAGTIRSSWSQTFVNWIDRASPASAPPSRASAASAGRGPVESEGARRLRQIIGEAG